MTTTPSEALRNIANRAPAQWRNELIEHADPKVSSRLAALAAKPASVKKIRLTELKELVDRIEDPALLASLYEADKRQGTKAMVSSHHLARLLPHSMHCSYCQSPLQEGTTLEDLLSSRHHCSRQLAQWAESRTSVEAQIEAWKAFLASGACEAEAELASAEGRLPEGVLAESSVAERCQRWEWKTKRNVNALLQGLSKIEVHHLPLLRACGGSLSNWKLDADTARAALAHGYGTSVMLQGVLDDDEIRAFYTSTTPQKRINMLKACTDQSMVEWMLHVMRELDPVETTANRQSELYVVLNNHPELSSAARLEILTRCEPDILAQFASGRLRSLPRTGEITAAVDQMKNETIALSRALRAMRSTEPSATLYESELIENALTHLKPAKSAFGVHAENVTFAAHRRLWAQLNSSAERACALNLLPQWEGTIDELADAARQLS